MSGPPPPDDAPQDGAEPTTPDAATPSDQASERDGSSTAILTEDERTAEIAAADERAREQATIGLEAGFAQRFVAAVTGTSVLVTLLAFVAAFIVGGIVIALSDETTQQALGYFTARPSDTFVAAWEVISAAYVALITGSLGGRSQISETLVAATPLILTGLAVAVPLRAGLFNIGGEGQVIAGGMVAGLIGFSFPGLPLIIHLPFALLGGLLAGALYGWVPGVLKQRTGAHEVITTIMLNNIGVLTSAYLLSTLLFRVPERTDPISRPVAESATLPRFVPELRVNVGIVIALLLGVLIFWLVERSAQGFELNAVGLNPHAATTSGMDPGRTVMRAMTVGGALAGTAGASVILGVQGRITTGFSAGLGFDGITVALLGRGRIGGTVAAGLLFGALKSGGRSMQAQTGTSLDLVLVIQALIIIFVAAPGLVRAIFRVRAEELTTAQVAKGWGS